MIIGYSTQVDSQVHMHVREVLKTPRIRAPEHNPVRSGKHKQLANAPALYASHSRPNLSQSERNLATNIRNASLDSGCNRTFKRSSRLSGQDCKEIALRVTEVLPKCFQEQLYWYAPQWGWKVHLQPHSWEQIRWGDQAHYVNFTLTSNGLRLQQPALLLLTNNATPITVNIDSTSGVQPTPRGPLTPLHLIIPAAVSSKHNDD